MFKKGMIRFRRKMAAVLAAAMLFSSYPLPAYAAGEIVSEDETITVSEEAASDNEAVTEENDTDTASENGAPTAEDEETYEADQPEIVDDMAEDIELVGDVPESSSEGPTELFFNDIPDSSLHQFYDGVLDDKGLDGLGKNCNFLPDENGVSINGFTIYDYYPFPVDWTESDSFNKIKIKKYADPEEICVASSSRKSSNAFARFNDDGTLFEKTGIKFNTVEDSEVAVVAKGGSGSKVYMKVEGGSTEEAVTLSEEIPAVDIASVLLFKAGADKTCYLSADPGVCIYFVKVMPTALKKSWDFTNDELYGTITDNLIQETTVSLDGLIVDTTNGYLKRNDDYALLDSGAKIHIPVYDNSVVRISVAFNNDLSAYIKVNDNDDLIQFTDEVTFKCVEGKERAGYLTISAEGHHSKYAVENRIKKIEIFDLHTVSFNALGENVGSAVFGDLFWYDDRVTALAVENAVAYAPSGKVFVGWSESENGELFDFNTDITENKIFYAIYEDTSNETGELFLSDIDNLTSKGKLKYRFASVNGFTIYDKSNSRNSIRIRKNSTAVSTLVASADKASTDTYLQCGTDDVLYNEYNCIVTFKPSVDSEVVIVAQNTWPSRKGKISFEYKPNETSNIEKESYEIPYIDNDSSITVIKEVKADSFCALHMDKETVLYYVKIIPKSDKKSWDFTVDAPFGGIGDEIAGTRAYVDGLFVDTTGLKYRDGRWLYIIEDQGQNTKIAKYSDQAEREAKGIHLDQGAVIYVPVSGNKLMCINAPNGYQNILINGIALTAVRSVVPCDAIYPDDSEHEPIYLKIEAANGDADLKKIEIVDPEPISATVTFKVVNGSWNDGTSADKTVTLEGYKGETLNLSANQIPAVGNMPGDIYWGGSWDETPNVNTPITEDKTYTYTYTIKNASQAVIPPTAKTLTYTGSAQELVNAGSIDSRIGTIKYAVTDGTNTTIPTSGWSISLPKRTDAGSYNVFFEVVGSGETFVASDPVKVTIAAKPVVVSGITAGNKTYDGTTAATLNYSNVKFDNAKVSGLTVTATGVFDDADAGTDKTVKISGITLTGTAASNYTLASTGQQTTATADITKASHDNKNATASAKYGNSGTVDLKDLMETEGTLSYYSKNDSYSIISGTPAVSGSVLTFNIANKASAAGKTATITVKAGSKNYQDYNIVVTVSVQDKDAQTVAFAGITDGTVSAVYGDASFIETATTTGNGAISYSSSNTKAAAVDSASGEVTIKGAGTATITATAAETDEYKAGTASYTLTVAKKAVTVSSISANGKTYDGNTSATFDTSKAAFEGVLAGDTLTVTATGIFDDANVGEDKEVTISGWTLGGASKDNYKVAETGNQTTAMADITVRPVTIKAQDQKVEIGKNIATGVDQVSVTAGSLVRGHSIASISLKSTSTNELTNEGSISVSEAVIKSGTTEVTSNYKITYEDGVMTVTNLKAIMITEPETAADLVYTGVSQNLIASVGTAETSVEFSLNDTDYDDAIPTGIDAKTYTVYYRAKGDDSHEPGDSEHVTVAIEKAQLTVTASANTITYGDTPSANGVVYTGFVNDETETVLKGTLAYDFTYQQYGNVGTYDIMPKGLTADNYELTFEKGTLTVTKKAVTVSANAQTIAKDGKISTSLNQAVAITPVGEDELSAVTLTASINAASTEGVIIPSAAKFSRGTDDVTANYEISYVNGKLNIKPAAVVTVVPAAKSLSYNGTDQELVTAGTVSGGSIVYSLSENGTYSESIPTGKDAGTYTVYYKPVPDADHSEGVAGSVEVTIAKAAANVKAEDKLKTAGKADPELTATVSGTYGSDNIDYTLSRESGEDVGTYVITASGNAVQGNYNVSYINGVLTISANSITPSVSLSQITYTYDGTEKKPAVTVKAGETFLTETDYTVKYTNNINAGTADVTVSEAEGGSYSFDPITVHFTIEKAAIKPSVSINSWVYGEEASKPSVSGNAGNGAVTYTYKVKDADDNTYTSEVPSNMGSYTVKADIAETANYLSGSAIADFEITMAEQGSTELKFIFEEGEPKPEYTGSAITPKVLGYSGNDLLTEGVDYSVTYSKNINAGTAEAKVSGKGDYAGSETLSFNIAPKKLSDENGAPAEGIVVTGLVVQGTSEVKPKLIYNGVLVASKEYGCEASKTASGNEAVTITAKDINFTGSIENLEVTRITDRAEFKKAEIKVKLNKVSRTYDGTPQLIADELIVTNKEGTALVEDTDYIVSYSADVINAGTVKVNIVGIGKHTGSVAKSYKIAPAKNAEISMSFVPEEGKAVGTYTFVKTGVTPEVKASAKVNGHTYVLEEGKDFTVTYSNNKKADKQGKAKLTMLGNYKGAKAVTETFDIDQASLNDVEVFLGDMIYKKPGTYKSKYVISFDGETLATSDYKVSYSDNGKVTLADNENEKTVTVTITSKDKNFKSGSITKTYKVYRNASATDVSKASVKLVAKGGTKSQSSVGFTGAPITFDPADDNRQADISVKIGKTTLYGAQVFEYFDVSYADNVLKGKGTIILTAKDTEGNPYSGMCSGKFTIATRKIK